MNQLEKIENQPPATANDIDPFAAYGAAIASESAPFLKFVKGAYTFGTEGEELELGKRLVPCMEELHAGYIKWHDGEPVEERMERVVEGAIPKRADMGDTDKSDWPVGPNGVSRDPWQYTNTLPMKDPETGQQFVFTTGSQGGIDAIGKLSVKYGTQRRKYEGKLPVIELGEVSYKHKTYGQVFKPVFKIIEWVSEADLIAGVTDEPEVLDDIVPF
jgi:hypothetical protein